MAIYHFSGQILGRTVKANPDGTRRPPSNAVAAAAYRSGSRLVDRTSGDVHDYSQRRGVVHSEILAPPGSAPWLEDRETLWNTVEAMESRKDAQLAREFNMALPHELSAGERLELARDFVQKHFVHRGMVADLALHDPVPDNGQSRFNFHAHVMLTLRRATASWLDPVKTREWNSKELLGLWRAEWALACNVALERAGHKVRIDHRTLEAQRDQALQRGDMARAAMLNRQPEIHVGPKARQMVRRERTAVSRTRDVGAYRKRDAAGPTARRKRDYPAYDAGSRLNWLEKVVAENNEQLKRDMVKLNRRFDRYQRKLDYWERRASFYMEGQIKGKAFRFQRWQAAQMDKQRQEDARRKAAHARKRAEQLRSLVKVLEGLVQGIARGREASLIRQREVERWLQTLPRTRDRDRK